MGNSLCKEPRAGSSMRPGRVLDSFGSIMCPNGLGKPKHGINKTYLSRHVLETSSKPNTLSSWNNAPLASPDSSKVIDTAPVAPPRKKRTTLERGTSPDAMMKVRNGFKDVFGAESRRQSCDVVAKSKPVDTVDKSAPLKSQSSFEIDVKDEEFTDFSKVPTKTEMEPSPKVALDPHSGTAKGLHVGNRKSDKFFGENLSDSLSDDPVVAERRRSAKKGMADLDKIDQFIEKNVLNMTAEPESKAVPEIKITEPEAKVDMAIPKPVEQHEENTKESANDEKLTEQDLMKYIDESMLKETSLGKKAEFLMAMLEDYPEDRYMGMTPVEEPIIIPRKRKSRHICDNDEHMHNMLHKHENEVSSSKNLITTEASIETPPRKPNRDFSRYLAAMGDGNDTDDSTSSGPIRRRSAQKAPPSPPVPHKLPKSPSDAEFQQNLSNTVTSTPKKLEASAETKAHSPRTLKRIISMPTNLVKQEARSPSPRPAFVKSNSSSSFLVLDLQQAHKKVVPFTPEDPQHNAPDELVKPKSRLAVRKTSTKSSDGTPYTATPTLEIPAPKFTIGGSSECLSNAPDVEPPPPPVPKRRKSSIGDNRRSPPRDLLGYDLGGFLVSSNILPHHDITHVINTIYNDKNSGDDILEEFHVYLEEQINAELNNPDPKNPNTAKLLEVLSKQSNPEDRLEDINIDLVGSENSNKSSDIDDCFDPEFEKIEKTDVEEATLQHGGGVVDNWFDNNSDTGSVVEGSDKLGNMVTVKSSVHRPGRRESIEDVDNWFQNHIQSSLLDEQIIGLRKQRRGSDGFLAYDMSRQYPFGQDMNRHDSRSADMFEDITKLHDLGSERGDEGKTQLTVVKNDRLRDRRGSDGLVFYDTSRKFPFGEPNENLPKAIEKSMKDEQKSVSNNVTSESTLSKANLEKHTAKEQTSGDGSSDHSTLLKFLSKENLVE